MPAHTSLTPITGDCPKSVGAGGLEQRGQRGGFWRPQPGLDLSSAALRLPVGPAASPPCVISSWGRKPAACPAYHRGVNGRSLHASTVAFVSWKSCGEAEGRGRGQAEAGLRSPSGQQSPALTAGRARDKGAASRKVQSCSGLRASSGAGMSSPTEGLRAEHSGTRGM